MADIDLATLGARGVRFNGVADDVAGSGVSAGDFNNDGFIDLIIGAPSLGSDRDEFGGEREGPGRVYIALGSALGFSPTVELGALGPGQGIEIVGGEEFRAGRSVASFGDLNGDGIDEILIESNGFNPGGSLSGAAHVVFGRSSGLPSVIDLAALNGANGFTLVPDEFDYAGRDVSFAGDLSGDGIDDLLDRPRRKSPVDPLAASSKHFDSVLRQ